MDTKPRVPLNVGWLSEEGLLARASELLGYTLDSYASEGGCYLLRHAKEQEDIAAASGFVGWDEDLMFTVAQLIELDFEPGVFQYCLDCKRLQVDCDEERRQIAEHNDM